MIYLHHRHKSYPTRWHHRADSPQFDFKENYEVISLGADKVQDAKDIQHDLLEMACFLHASRARKVMLYYKSRPCAR